MKEVLINMLLPAIKGLAKVYLKSVLQKIQDHNTPEVYESTLKNINSSFTLLDEVAQKSKTKIDDDIIEAVLESVQESALEDDIQL